MDEISGQNSNSLAVYINNQMIGTATCWGKAFPLVGCSNPIGVITLTPDPGSANPSGPTLTFTIITTNQGAFLLEGTAGASGQLNPAPGKNVLIGEIVLGTQNGTGFLGTNLAINTLHAASTDSATTLGTANVSAMVAPPPPAPPPAGFSGSEDICMDSATCLNKANQPVSANYSIDANGRITLNFGSGGFPSGIIPGWEITGSSDAVFLEPSVHGTVIFVGQMVIP